MKKSLLVLILFFQVSFCKAQFSFQMNFIDGAGNLDSVILGFDINASDTIDPSFGEVNIISNPINPGLDVRTSNTWWKQNSLSYADQLPFQTKVQISKDSCGASFFPIIELDIVTDHYPVIAYWNHNLFNTTCLNGSVFTSVHPGGWWDTGGNTIMLRDVGDSSFPKSQYTIINGPDTAAVYWVAFSDSTIFFTGIDDLIENDNSVTVFPNPTSGQLTVNISETFGQLKYIEIYNSVGQKVLSSLQINLDLISLSNGVYFIKVINSKGFSAMTKFSKI
jgi:hypothetical protein